MDFQNIIFITFISTVILYLSFLLIGVGGITNNREAQGLDQKSKK